MQLQGDVLEQLARLKAEGVKVRTCVTSPPYWGLRAYGTNPQIWANGHALCVEHEWNTTQIYSDNPIRTSGKEAFSYDIELKKKQRWRENTICNKCGAWRGELGLEPTPELYVAHLVQVFRAVRDVLAEDGTLWLNLGDTYHGGGGGNYGSGLSVASKHNQHLTNVRNKIELEGIKPKDLVGIPWRVAFALQADGWYLRSDIIWHKPNPVPESVRDRPTKSHEYIFLLSKSPRYYYDLLAMQELANYDGRKDTMMKGSARYANGHAPTSPNTLHVKGHERWAENDNGDKIRNKRSVWSVNTAQFNLELCQNCNTVFDKKQYRKLAEHIEIVDGIEKKSRICTCGAWDRWLSHFATFPPDLIEPCILAGSERGDLVLDPFGGSGTTAEVALKHGRRAILIELNPSYVELQKARLAKVQRVMA